MKDFTTTIDGITYRTKLFPATEGISFAWRLGRLLDENAIGQMLLAVDVDEEGMSFEQLFGDMGLMASFAIKANEKVSPAEAAALSRDAFRYTTADKVRIGDGDVLNASIFENFDTHFAGRYMHLYKVWWWVVRLGFAGP